MLCPQIKKLLIFAVILAFQQLTTILGRGKSWVKINQPLKKQNGEPEATREDMLDEIRALRKQLARSQRDNEILKKQRSSLATIRSKV